MLVFDSGDFIGRHGKRGQIYAEYTLRSYAQMNYDAIGLGERDFWQEISFLKSIQAKYNIPFVSANIYHPDGKTPFFEPYIIKKLNGFKKNRHKVPSIRVGIFGLLFKRLQLVKDKNEPQLIVGDPIEAAKRIVPELREKCDLVIALAHIRYPHIKNLALEVQGIDVIIGAHDPIYRPNPELHGNTIAIIGGNRGQYIGDLRLDFDKDKNVIDHMGRVVLLNKDIKSDSEILKLVNEFEAARRTQIRQSQINK